jgi:hypothetical protein
MKINFSIHSVPYRNNQCCRSEMFILDPRWGILIFSIPDPRSPTLNPGFNNNRKEEEGKICYLTFFVSINLTKL